MYHSGHGCLFWAGLVLLGELNPFCVRRAIVQKICDQPGEVCVCVNNTTPLAELSKMGVLEEKKKPSPADGMTWGERKLSLFGV